MIIILIDVYNNKKANLNILRGIITDPINYFKKRDWFITFPHVIV